ncbi:MAG: tetratricopeptide repeat protein [Cryomorphaceae bacterium]|nr:tetratricopeptide repeat protein [Cryomorphaceae bacterium]
MKGFRRMAPALALLLFACQQSTVEEDKNLKALEKEAFSSQNLDVDLGKELLSAYRSEMQKGLDAEILFKAGEVAYNLPDREDEAMEYFQRLSIKFPKHEKAPHAVFYKGLIYENRWNDKEMAAKTWEEFLVRYPSHELANDAADLLTLARDTADDLEKVNQWLKEIEQNK